MNLRLTNERKLKRQTTAAFVALMSGHMECGGKRSATPLWHWRTAGEPKRRRRSALPAHSIWWRVEDAARPRYSDLSHLTYLTLSSALDR